MSVKRIKEHCMLVDIQAEDLLYLAMNEIDIFGKGNKNQVIDVETNQKMNINFSEANRKKYKAAMEEHNQRLSRFCRINRIVYSLAKTNIKFEDFILRELPRIGFIR